MNSSMQPITILIPTAFRRAFNTPVQETLCPADCDPTKKALTWDWKHNMSKIPFPEEHQYPLPTLNACWAAKAGEPLKLSVEYVLDALAASNDAYCNANDKCMHKQNAMQDATSMIIEVSQRTDTPCCCALAYSRIQRILLIHTTPSFTCQRKLRLTRWWLLEAQHDENPSTSQHVARVCQIQEPAAGICPNTFETEAQPQQKRKVGTIRSTPLPEWIWTQESRASIQPNQYFPLLHQTCSWRARSLLHKLMDLNWEQNCFWNGCLALHCLDGLHNMNRRQHQRAKLLSAVHCFQNNHVVHECVSKLQYTRPWYLLALLLLLHKSTCPWTKRLMPHRPLAKNIAIST